MKKTHYNGGRPFGMTDEKTWLVDQLVALWKTYAEDYRTLVMKYQFLLAEKKAGRKIKLTRLPAVVINELPDIFLFNYWNKDDVREYLKELEIDELSRMLAETQWILEENYSYNTIRNWVKEASYELAHQPKGRRALYY